MNRTKTAETFRPGDAAVPVVGRWWLLPRSTALGKLLPRCTPALSKSLLLVDIWTTSKYFLLYTLNLVVEVHSDGLYSVPGQCSQQDHSCTIVRAHRSTFRPSTLWMNTQSKCVLLVHMKVWYPLRSVEVDCQLGWYMPRQSGNNSLCTCSTSSSVRCRLWAPS